MRRHWTALYLLISVMIATMSWADTQSDYAAARSYVDGQSLSNQLSSSVTQAQTALPAVNDHPPQTRYYQDSTAMSGDAATTVTTQNTVGHEVSARALTRPRMSVNPNAPEIRQSKTIQQNANAINDGTYADCDKKNVTHITTTQRQCQTPLPQTLICTENLTARLEEHWRTQTKQVNLAGRTQLAGGSRASVHLDEEKGTIIAIALRDSSGGRPWHCDKSYGLNINDETVAWYAVGPPRCFDYINQLNFNASQRSVAFEDHTVRLFLREGAFSGTLSGTITYTYPEKYYEPVTQWRSSCTTLPEACSITHTQCVEGEATKTVDRQSVSAPCWKKEIRYQCGAPRSTQCQTLLDQGCTTISSQCSDASNGFCNRFTQTMSCPDTQTLSTGLQCGTQFYCMDGNCEPTSHESNHEIGRSITELSAVNAVAEEVNAQGGDPTRDPESIRIFTGKQAHCREVVLGSLNCCHDHGWAKDIFANCTQEERDLGHAKEQGVVVKTGRYCAARVLGVCTEHKQGYCIFPSLIAYDVQVGGRRDQLHREFGDGEHPDCSGLSPSEIAQLHFDRIDFSNAISSVMQNVSIPQGDTSSTRIQTQLQQHLTRAQAHE